MFPDGHVNVPWDMYEVINELFRIRKFKFKI